MKIEVEKELGRTDASRGTCMPDLVRLVVTTESGSATVESGPLTIVERTDLAIQLRNAAHDLMRGLGGYIDCRKCLSTGLKQRPVEPVSRYTRVTCPTCGGAGVYYGGSCLRCHGVGSIKKGA